jgi:hypothetical protein
MNAVDQAILTAEYVARNTIPDLTGRELYIVEPGPGTMMTPEMLVCVKGFYCRGLDQAMRQLEMQGRWKGPGVCVVIDAVGCFAVGADDGAGARYVIGTTLHELTHWLDMGEPTEVAADRYTKIVDGLNEYQSATVEPQKFPKNFLLHGGKFQRLAVHIWWRACHGGGHILRPRYLSIGSTYDGLEMLPSPDELVDALGEELELLADMPLRRIASLPRPPAYTDLWKRTLRKMFLEAVPAA